MDRTARSNGDTTRPTYGFEMLYGDSVTSTKAGLNCTSAGELELWSKLGAIVFTTASGAVAIGPGTSASGAGATAGLTGGAGAAGGNNVGGAATITGGAGAGTSAGGAAQLIGGAGGAGATGNGGAAVITGGAATSTNGTGGAVTVAGGLGTGSGNGGAVTITSGAAGATGVAGAISIVPGAATAGAGATVTITGGAGAGGTNAGGHVNLVPGAAVSTGTPGEVQVNGNGQLIPVNIPLIATDASRAVFIATRPMRLQAASSVFSTASTSGTWKVEKLTGTTAAGGGTALNSAAVALSGSANTVANATIDATVAQRTFATGDRLGIVIAGTMTNLVNGFITVFFQPT